MKAVFEWSASDKLLREELIATGIAGKVNRYVEIDMQQLDTDTRRRIVALAGSISSDPLRIRSNEAIKPDAVASTRARGDNGLSRISLYFDQEPTMEEALVAAERFIAGMALVRVADRGYRAEKGIVAKRCRHDNVEITEFGTSATTHLRSSAGCWDHDSDFGDYTGIIEVYCPECGYKRRFGQRRPKWVQEMWDELDDARVADPFSH